MSRSYPRAPSAPASTGRRRRASLTATASRLTPLLRWAKSRADAVGDSEAEQTDGTVSVRPRAVVLLSGGLDSSTVLAIAQSDGFDAYALSFRYGQRHDIELAAARAVAQKQGAVEHRIAEIDLGAFGGSALTDDAIAVPHHDAEDSLDGGIPITYVPARNTIFLSYALAWAEVLGSSDIYLGVSAIDYSGYPDCRPEYLAAFQAMANLATKAGVEGTQRLTIHAPLIDLSKADTIRRGFALGVDYGLTHSCYDPVADRPCGTCDSCLLRARGFAEAGVADPAL